MSDNSHQTIQAIGVGLITIFIIGTAYTFWSLTQGNSIEQVRPYMIGSIFSLIIGALFWYSTKRKSRE